MRTERNDRLAEGNLDDTVVYQYHCIQDVNYNTGTMMRLLERSSLQLVWRRNLIAHWAGNRRLPGLGNERTALQP